MPHIVSPLASPSAAAFAPGARAVKALVGQELRAHPVLLVWTPVVILGAFVLVVAALVVGTWLTDTAPEPISPGGRENDLPRLVAVLTFFYLARSVHRERRPGSTLFWKATPVSDALFVVSKLVTGAVVLPGIWLIVTIALFLPTAALVVLLWGPMVDVTWATFWGEVDLAGSALGVVAGFLTSMLWALPAWCWVLLASIVAPRLPSLVALAPLGLTMLVDIRTSTVFDTLSIEALAQAPLTGALLDRMFDGPLTAPDTLDASLVLLGQSGLYGGLAVAAILGVGAVAAHKRSGPL